MCLISLDQEKAFEGNDSVFLVYFGFLVGVRLRDGAGICVLFLLQCERPLARLALVDLSSKK